MAKNNRGKLLRETIPGSARGKCPSCARTGIKLLHEVKVGEKTVMVCKNCRKVDGAKLAE
ncbi:MAG: hypothetical protein P9L91_04325 [Candidatus Zophobacter franzmannii]|jgi:hypothetical protein|nr:hypothetical protein [Candidatus Zophobacter franzmannii]